ncbi:MAG: adenylyl-sulfate kinase [Candidatus Nanopelagicales bacterium]|jgi:bifunctional enzyme CysN/CysC|nr:adenylyl-sulfate kinase [Candidatus Nanopelagicales bacterium]
MGLIRLVACGSVDDGKSTLIGRLLADTDSVPEDTLELARTVRRAGSTIPAGVIDYSLLTDGLEAEREQGITIDVAYRHMALPDGRRVVIADAPGHEQYTRNMAVAASTADVALLLVDAARGVTRQTYRHLTICALMGVHHVIIAVNKLDAVGFDHARFSQLADAVAGAAARLDFSRVTVIPVSALDGDNVITSSRRTEWYAGPSVITAIGETHELDAPPATAARPVRIPVQTVVRADGFRGVAGTLVTGQLAVGDEVAVAGTGVTGRVGRLLVAGADRDRATAGDAVALELLPDLDVTRGDLLESATSEPVIPADRFSADVVWLGEEPLAHGRSYLLVCGPLVVPAVVTSVRHRLDVTTGSEEAARILSLNDVGRVEVATDRPIPLEAYLHSRDTGGFVLVDRLSADTVAAGMVRYALRRSANVRSHEFVVDRAARERLNGHRGRVIWLTGLSGSGKSTIADAAERDLHAQGVRTFVLDGDNVRHGLNKDLGFTSEDRAENVRRVAEVARLMVQAGTVVIVALVSPFRGDRRAARDLFEPGDFVEVFVRTPVEVCAARDPKGLYAKAATGELPNLTGVGQDYEEPLSPDLVVAGDGELQQAVAAVVAEAVRASERG